MLPRNRLGAFEAFLAKHGVVAENATPELKVGWLLGVVNENPTPTWTTIQEYARGLERLGPSDDDERMRQAEIIRGLMISLRNQSIFPPSKPHFAMPRHLMEELVGRFHRTKPPEGLASERMRTQLKLAWATGIRLREMHAMRQNWLRRSANGYLLTIRTGPLWTIRELPIPRLKQHSICAATELDHWLTRLPRDPNGFVFLRTSKAGKFYAENAPFCRDVLTQQIRYHLRQMGHPRYGYMSIRVSFLKRCREQLGDAAAFYLSGIKQYEKFMQSLRGEADFITFPEALDRRHVDVTAHGDVLPTLD